MTSLRTPRNMRQWRTEYQGKLWTKGSRAGCIGRFFCCTIMIFLLFFIRSKLQSLERQLLFWYYQVRIAFRETFKHGMSSNIKIIFISPNPTKATPFIVMLLRSSRRNPICDICRFKPKFMAVEDAELFVW